MNEIKVEFKRCDYFVFGKVISMPEELRGIGKIISNESYSIYSEAHPALYDRELTLRGGIKDSDNYYFGCNYKNSAEAQLAISEFENLIKKWNTEHREILNDAEKSYLEAVIKPFKYRIEYILKRSFSDTDEEYLVFGMTPDNYFFLPNFKKGEMYKGMEPNREYILNQLGLE